MRKHDMYGNSAVANLGDRSATINIAEKWEGAAVPLSVEGYGSPSNTMSPGSRCIMAKLLDGLKCHLVRR